MCYTKTMLIFAQTLFYLTVSFAIIALSVLFGIIAYHLIKITRDLGKISNNLGDASEEVLDNLSQLIDRLSSLPILSMFLRNQTAAGEHRKKGRSK